MIKTARQLKDLIRNLSKKNAADAQILMRNYMMERFLERISLSSYRDKFILKGGMLAAAHKRGTERHLAEAAEVFDEVENSPVMQDLWAAYQKKFSYASDLGWDTVMAAVRQLFARCEGTV